MTRPRASSRVARHCARLCRARVSLTRTSSRTPASLSSSPAVVSDARARRHGARARRLDDATKHAISRVIARVCDASVGHSRTRHPEPRFPLVFPPSSPTRARSGHSGGGGGGGTRARVASMARWRTSSRVIARACNARVSLARASSRTPASLSSSPPVVSHRARERRRGGVAAAAWRRRHARARRLDDATARAIARHCARLCRARVSLTRTSSRTPASLSSSRAVVPDARARRRRRRGGGGVAAAARARRRA